MQFLSKVNTTIKIIIMLVYTLIISLLSVGIIKIFEQPVTRFKDFGSIPGDENIGLLIRIEEKRTAPALEEENKREDSKWSIVLTLTKKENSSTIRNVSTFLTVQTIKDDFIYKEEGPRETFPSTNYYNNTFSNVAKKANIYQSATKTFAKTNEEPKSVFVQIVYEFKPSSATESVVKKIKYRADLLQQENYDFSTFAERTGNENAGTIPAETDSFGLTIKKQATTEEETSAKYLIQLRKEGSSATTAPAIPELRLALFAKSQNDPTDVENYFSDYLQFVHYYGDIESAKTIAYIQPSVAKRNGVSNVYVVSQSFAAGRLLATANYVVPLN